MLKDLFWGVNEIAECLEMLRDAELYVRRFPYGRESIPKTRYLKYQVGAYFNEVYILKERVAALGKVIRRKYRENTGPRINTFVSACQRFETAIGSIVEARGSHVHQQRFQDIGIERVRGLELGSSAIGEDLAEEAAAMADSRYRVERKRWAKTIASNNSVLDDLVDDLFDSLSAVVFESDGSMRTPDHWPDA